MVCPATRLKVAVKSPATKHELTVAKLQSWLESSGRIPNQQALKVRLRELLEGTWRSAAKPSLGDGPTGL
jgi:hypothetical protein